MLRATAASLAHLLNFNFSGPAEKKLNLVSSYTTLLLNANIAYSSTLKHACAAAIVSVNWYTEPAVPRPQIRRNMLQTGHANILWQEPFGSMKFYEVKM